ncbi:hypothetical protein T439DRAFT_326264 [Meredithblackwellia eburnea MCA 4105]
MPSNTLVALLALVLIATIARSAAIPPPLINPKSDEALSMSSTFVESAVDGERVTPDELKKAWWQQQTNTDGDWFNKLPDTRGIRLVKTDEDKRERLRDIRAAAKRAEVVAAGRRQVTLEMRRDDSEERRSLSL